MKYILKHRFIKVGSNAENLYLAYNTRNNSFCFITDFGLAKRFDVKAVFCIREIEKIKNDFKTDLKDFELIEVLTERKRGL